MKYDHDRKPRPARVAEPVQVYLRGDEKARLDRLTEELDTSKSDVLRKGLEALERQIMDPDHHPALSIIGIAGTAESGAGGRDVARDHDDDLADGEISSWASSEEPGS
jgi:Arc/MetJ-type ribon-helix-helix transcriptional regulator